MLLPPAPPTSEADAVDSWLAPSQFDRMRAAPLILRIAALAMMTSQDAVAATRPVITEKAAVAIAIRACDESWGKFSRKQHIADGIPRRDWHAVKRGDHWNAWQGTETQPAYQVDVPTDGRRLDGQVACMAQMGWAPSEGPIRTVTGHF